MTPRERRVLLVSKILTVVMTALPAVVQIGRLHPSVSRVLYLLSYPLRLLPFWVGGRVASMWFFLFISSIFVTPALVAWGIGFTLLVRRQMRSRGQEDQKKPRLFVFVICGFVWLLVYYSFKILPLFVGETVVRRGFIDGWLDKLL